MSESVVTTLRRVLAEAEAGNVTAVAIATSGPDLSTGSSYTLGDATLAELLGSIALLTHRIMRAAETEELD